MGSEDNLSKVPVIIKAKNGLIQINAEIQVSFVKKKLLNNKKN